MYTDVNAIIIILPLESYASEHLYDTINSTCTVIYVHRNWFLAVAICQRLHQQFPCHCHRYQLHMILICGKIVQIFQSILPAKYVFQALCCVCISIVNINENCQPTTNRYSFLYINTSTEFISQHKYLNKYIKWNTLCDDSIIMKGAHTVHCASCFMLHDWPYLHKHH